MNRPRPILEASIWRAALLSAGCVAHKNGQTCPVEWRSTPAGLQFTATDVVVVQPFDVVLRAGEVLEVWWGPNETAYSLTITEAHC